MQASHRALSARPVAHVFRAAAPAARPRASPQNQGRGMTTVRAASSDASSRDPPARQAISSLVSSIYKVSAGFQAVDPSLSPLWAGLMKLDKAAVAQALRQGASPDEPNAQGDTPLLYIARAGHYKFPPSEIPALLVQSGANLEAKDATGKTALQVALLAGWQNIAYLLIDSGADTSGVAAIKSAITCPDCKKAVASLA